MNVFQQIGLGMMVGLATLSSAQSPPSPSNPSTQATDPSLAAPSPSPAVPIEPASLIPPDMLPAGGLAALPQIPAAPDLQMLNALFKQSSLGKVADENRLHLQMVKLENRIRNDAALQAARVAADNVSTDLERRRLLKQYYHQYYDRLRAMAETPDLKTYLDGQESAHVGVLAQPRVRPDSNPATASAAAKPLPTPIQARASQTLQNP